LAVPGRNPAYDPWMAVRIYIYLGLLYQDLIRARQLSNQGCLPPVLPIVLYNGAEPCLSFPRAAGERTSSAPRNVGSAVWTACRSPLPGPFPVRVSQKLFRTTECTEKGTG